ncbi:MAG TPA: hypothetical protein VGJ20_18040 [Xanthobacteraceae bacterium]|jgi:hypothetical protein
MRPKTIVYFEWIIFGTLVLGAFQSYLDWDRAVTVYPNPAVLIIFPIFMFVLGGTLILLVSRRRSKIAMWVLIATSVLDLLGFLVAANGLLESDDIIMAALQEIAQVVAYGLLFTPSARRWMNREDAKLTPANPALPT